MREPLWRSETWQCGARRTSSPTISARQLQDYRKRSAKHAPIHIDGAVVEQVESFKLLGVHFLSGMMTAWSHAMVFILAYYYLYR
jgi:acyl dehydratase